ncbi:hypothetical protein [Streptomyces sp. NPDC048644]|uniref:hypothetical protein n=1 Tax=Streptomyces sp. NPDC048644 TaxID=3365582 RepID=UPI0037226C03
MRWQAKHDRDAFKEVWLLFDNEHGRFPLYPGESVWIEYAYSVSDDKWGNWFQRAVRLPTEQLEVQLAFPTALDPVVWGTETSMTAEASPLRTPLLRSDDGEIRQFFHVDHDHTRPARSVPFGVAFPGTARTRHGSRGAQVIDMRPSQRMRDLGVVQHGAAILAEAARAFSLPT